MCVFFGVAVFGSKTESPENEVSGGGKAICKLNRSLKLVN